MSQQVTASYFHITKKDSIAADPSDPTYRSKIQLGEVRSQGMELESRWFVTEDWDVNASYTYIDMEVTEDANPDLEGTTPIYVPTHAANLWSNYYVYGGALSGTRFSVGARYMGEMEMDATNTQGKVPMKSTTPVMTNRTAGLVQSNLSSLV